MTANHTEDTTDEESTDDEPIFRSNDGLWTEQDIHSIFGQSNVTIDADGDHVTFEIGLGGGSVSAKMNPDRAREVAYAIEEAAAFADEYHDQ